LSTNRPGKVAKLPAAALPDGFPDESWLRAFRRRLLAWYGKHARQLPWRQTRDPYRVWISEIMLQQTQVATVIPYFQRFIEALPTVEHLAAADEQQVLRLWEGLGYYRRARQLHAAAKKIVAEHDGLFPADPAAIAKLPGIGRYTAAAVASIAFGAQAAILEANTRRLYARLLAERGELESSAAQARLWSFAEHLLPKQDCGAFNQALMELGATICTPRSPQCAACPVAELCPTFALGLQDEIPQATRKVKIEDVREAAVIVRSPAGQVLVLRYEPGQRWAGLWDFVRFPLPEGQALDTPAGASPATLQTFLANEVQRRTGYRVSVEPQAIAQIKHPVTRYRITLNAFVAQLAGSQNRRAKATAAEKIQNESTWVDVAELHHLPLSATGRKLARLVEKLPAEPPRG
jgi:A/G-specific adenine glycosylase